MSNDKYGKEALTRISSVSEKLENVETFVDKKSAEIPIINKIVDPSLPYKAPNASDKLAVPTYPDGGQQPTHPSVVYFKDSWNGYRYWMAHTPFPDGYGAFENPHIVSSHDGINWVEPEGISNPIFSGLTRGFYSDVDLLYLPHEDRLCLFWRYADNPAAGEIYYVSFSSDGINWTDKQVSLHVFTEFTLSASVVYDGEKYHMWYVGSENLATPVTGQSAKVRYRVSDSPLGPWSDPKETNLQGMCLRNNDVGLWHIDVNKYEEEFHMLICSSNRDLYLATSTDMFTWEATNQPILGKAGVGSGKFDEAEIYRSCGLLMRDGNNYTYKIWYGASGQGGKQSIGYTELNLGSPSMTIRTKRSGDHALYLEGRTDQEATLIEIQARKYGSRVLNVKHINQDRFYYGLGEGLRLATSGDNFILGGDTGAKLRINPESNIVNLQVGVSGNDATAKLKLSRYQSNSNIQTLEVGADTSLFKGDVELDNATKGAILKSPDGSRWRVQVGDDGIIKTTKL